MALALAPAQASAASGGYQPFKPAALAEKLDVTQTKARDLLAAELLRRVSDDFSGRIAENPEVSRYIDAHAPADLVKDGQHLFALLDRDSAEYLNSTINMANFNEGFDGRSTLDLYQFGVAASGGSPAALTAFSGVREDLTNYRQTYTREAEGNALMAGFLLSSIWAEQGSETTAQGKALQAEDPVKWQETQNWATALSNTMSGSYVNGAFKGKPLAPFSSVDPTVSTFDIFDYYAMRNLANGAVAVTGVSAGAMASRFAKLRAEMKASAGARLEKSGLATNSRPTHLTSELWLNLGDA
ncbi:hypothetical protein, partial [Thioclava indica]|uniref:hypothetical protein n=1 Tax=Thioclava indica TaxID=1353528 RepID=UPI0012DD4990